MPRRERAAVQLRVTIFLSDFGAGDAERRTVWLAGWLQSAGHQDQMLTLFGPAGNFHWIPTMVEHIGLDILYIYSIANNP